MDNLFRVAKAYRNDEREDQRDGEINVAIRSRPPERGPFRRSSLRHACRRLNGA